MMAYGCHTHSRAKLIPRIERSAPHISIHNTASTCESYSILHRNSINFQNAKHHPIYGPPQMGKALCDRFKNLCKNLCSRGREESSVFLLNLLFEFVHFHSNLQLIIHLHSALGARPLLSILSPFDGEFTHIKSVMKTFSRYSFGTEVKIS